MMIPYDQEVGRFSSGSQTLSGLESMNGKWSALEVTGAG